MNNIRKFLPLRGDKIWRRQMTFFLSAGILFFLLGILLPIMTVKKLVVVQNTFTILYAIVTLLGDKTFALGIILLIFSIIFPLLKFLAMLAYIIIYPPLPAQLVRWQIYLSKLSKFSMLDVFVIGQMLMILKLGWLVEIEIHSGIYWFSIAVIISIVASIAIENDISKRAKNAIDAR